MKKIVLAVVLITVLCLLVGCVPAAILVPTLVGNDADEKVMQANARNICTAINVYNALEPDDAIEELKPLAELKEKLGELYPPHLSDEEAEQALALIVIADGKAEVIEQD